MTSAWSRALDAQTMLREFWFDSDTEYQSARQDTIRSATPDMGPMQRSGILTTQQQATTLGEPYWISPDMSRWMAAASKDLPEDSLRREDCPADQGLIYLAEPLHIEMAKDREGLSPYRTAASHEEAFFIPIRIITWASVWLRSTDEWSATDYPEEDEPGKDVPGTYFACYSDLDDLPPEFWHAINRDPATVSHRVPYQWAHSDPWKNSTSHRNADFRKFILTLFRFMQQKISVTEIVQPGRAARRRFLRIHNSTHVPTLRVVRLRKERIVGEGSNEIIVSDVEWSHRWEVAGHWHKAAPNWKDQSPRYIHPYIKGPENKPFIPKKTLYRVDR